MKQHTLTIGIPAYNESKNIVNLINQIIKQKLQGFRLDKILISSDGSNDDTVKIVNNLNNSKVKIIDNKNRLGICRGLNQIIENTRSDILIILDGDIGLTDTNFIQRITLPISKNLAELTSCRLVEYPAKNFYSKMLWLSQQVKNNVFEQINCGDNLFNCKGPARAFARKLYQKLVFPKDLANDAFSYLRCHELGYRFNYVANTSVNYRLVDNFYDHRLQSLRFFKSTLHTARVQLSLKACLKGILLSKKIILLHPFHVIAYLFIQMYFQFEAYFKPLDINRWQIATSSK